MTAADQCKYPPFLVGLSQYALGLVPVVASAPFGVRFSCRPRRNGFRLTPWPLSRNQGNRPAPAERSG
jgi:hypothetical protein